MADSRSIQTDTAYLLNDQYKNADNLSARAQLHIRFSTNKQGWQKWLFEQFDMPTPARIIEFGTGASWLWAENLDRIPSVWDITLTDFSAGMLEASKQNLSASKHPFKHEVVDVQSIPYPDATFDAVIANHMLYHVPNIRQALSEMRRVLKPSGRLYTATNGEHHLREIDALQRRFDPNVNYWEGFSASRSYELDNAVPQLSEFFPHVVIHRYEDALHVTDADALAAYMLSGKAKTEITGEKLIAFRKFLQGEIDKNGMITITKDSGVLISSAEHI
jgi:ubiquinone/menaquinone biosynthesis C-methylase UbiE